MNVGSARIFSLRSKKKPNGQHLNMGAMAALAALRLKRKKRDICVWNVDHNRTMQKTMWMFARNV